MASPGSSWTSGSSSSGGGGGSSWLSGGGAAPKKKGGGGGVLGAVKRYSGAELVGNLASDVADTAVGVFPGLYHTGGTLIKEAKQGQSGLLRGGPTKGAFYNEISKPIAKQYAAYYGHNTLSHLYQHPLQPILDAATIASLGAGAGAKVGLLSDARVGLVTKSPRALATGKGPIQTELSSTRPFVRGREVLANKARTKEGIPIPGTGGTRRVGGQVKKYGKGIQMQATQHALENMQPIERYAKATKRLNSDEWSALHIRAMNIHPDDLAELWQGTPRGATVADPKVRALILNPSKRMAQAEPDLKALSTSGAELSISKRALKPETAAARPEKTRLQVSEQLGRPARTIPGVDRSYYIPHTVGPERPVSPLAATGGGKGVPKKLGSERENQGILALSGKMHLKSDLLGPEFLRRVKKFKYEEIHNGLVRGSVRVSKQEIDQMGGHLPAGWEYVRAKVGQKIPATMKVEGEQRVPIDQLIPNPADLHDSALAKEGFSTTDQALAHQSGGRYYIAPKAMVKAATGEFTRSSGAVNTFVRKPLMVWRAAVLGLRVGFLTNNLVGNSIMYGVKTGGEGALRNLFMAIRETHGDATALKVLKNQATPPKLRQDLTREFFPEQLSGTFGRSQSPATSTVHMVGGKALEAGRTVTGALPRLTSKVAEEVPRRALVRFYIEKSPEFRQVYEQLPHQQRTFETAARHVLEGKGGATYQRYISRQVNKALGDYLHLSPVERNVLRNTLPFYSWYRAITTTTYHLAVDTPLRANILGQIGRIGKEQGEQWLGEVPSFLKGAIPFGKGPAGTKQVVATQGLNPYGSLSSLLRGSTEDISQLGLNPFVMGPLQYYAAQAQKQQTPFPKISPAQIAVAPVANTFQQLPLSRLVQKPKPSKLYPQKTRGTELAAWLGVPVKRYVPSVAADQARKGR